MVREFVKITNKHGLHARPAANLVRVAGQFKSNITIIKDSLEVNGKSIMGVMMLAAEPGSELEFIVEGEDEKDAIKAIRELIANNFYEEQD